MLNIYTEIKNDSEHLLNEQKMKTMLSVVVKMGDVSSGIDLSYIFPRVFFIQKL